MPDGKEKTYLYCSFCGKSQEEVPALIAGPTVFICDDCGEICEDIKTVGRGENADSKGVFRLSLSRKHFADLQEKDITMSTVLGRECGAALTFAEVSLSDILNAIGRVIGQELGTGDERRDKVTESVLALQEARRAADPEKIQEMEEAHRQLLNSDPPPVVRLITIQ